MSTRKNNSILFLTTLGVYFGLMLVGGAAPQVFAHGALTRNFELQDEIEFSDDLDKKPEPTEKELKDAIDEYSKRIEEFVKNLRKLKSIDEFDESWQAFDAERTTFSACPETGTLRSTEDTRHIDPWLLPAITEAKFISENFTWLADCLPYDGFPNRSLARSSGIKLKYDKAELVHGLSIKFESESRASSIHKSILSAFKRFEIEEGDDLELNRVLLKHTALTTSNDQVFIVTRLPRADLDSLLATRAK